MQRVARLEPERVAGAEPAGSDAALEHAVPQRHGVGGCAEQLAPALARVSGPADDATDAEHLVLAERERRDVRAEQLQRGGPLHRQHRPVGRHVARLLEHGCVPLARSPR